MQFIKAGNLFHLDLSLDISIHRDVHFDEDELKLLIDGCVRSFFNDPYMVDFLEKGGEKNGEKKTNG